MLDQKRLKELLHYNPETGLFTNLTRRANRIVIGTEAGGLNGSGYRHIEIEGHKYKAHRLAFLYMTGENPPKLVDHINRVKHDNRWCNLRLADATLNRINTDVRVDSKSGVTGVNPTKTVVKGKTYLYWRAYISIQGVQTSLGTFKHLFDAVTARKRAEKEHGYLCQS